MTLRLKRKNYFTHPSSQIKHMVLTILPAVIMSLFCTYFLIKSGEMIVKIEKEKLFIEITSITQTIHTIENKGYPVEIMDNMKTLNRELSSLEHILRVAYLDTVNRWREAKILIFIVLSIIVAASAVFSIIYSHRVAGPIYRITRCIDMLSHGYDIPPVRLRRHDEFKELAAALEALRKDLKEKGMLRHKG